MRHSPWILRHWKPLLALSMALLIGNVFVVWGSHIWVKRSAVGRCYRSTALIPEAPVALVLGCAPTAHGRPNVFFKTRIQAAADLYKAGKVRALIVSGDNSTRQYDEPTAMKQALTQAGVPESRIYCDYAGFRTLDSIVRAETIFGQKRFIIVSQRFHNERAIFLARQHGLEDVVALDAPDVVRSAAPATYLREVLARVQAVLDVKVLRTKPKFDGPPIVVETS